MLRNLYILIFVTCVCASGCLRIEPGRRRVGCDPTAARQLANDVDFYAPTDIHEEFCQPGFYHQPRFAMPQRLKNATDYAVSAVSKRLDFLKHRPRLTDHVYDLKERYRLWRRSREEKAQAPPWPRFHPVPTRDVFLPTEATNFDSPVVYGQFASQSDAPDRFEQSASPVGSYEEAIPAIKP